MKNVHRQRGACMIYFDILLVAIACITMPFIVAVMLDIFYAERKKYAFHYVVLPYGISLCLRYPLYHPYYLSHKTYNLFKHLGVSELKVDSYNAN